MSRATRKYDSVDIMKLYTLGSTNGWNKYLDETFKSENINSLARMRYALQAGMDDLAKAKLNTPEMIKFYLRLMRSTEQTAKQIIRKIYPMPHDLPTIHGIQTKKERPLSALEAKRKRDLALEKFFMDSSF